MTILQEVDDDQAEMMEFLRESREDVEAGRTKPALDALKLLAKKHKLARRHGLHPSRSRQCTGIA
jgi:phage terminase Nu1 subunit (DNA packaging protein)